MTTLRPSFSAVTSSGLLPTPAHHARIFRTFWPIVLPLSAGGLGLRWDSSWLPNH